jgi:glycosyltransferase involved in cell wall biosynthesis
MKIAIDARFWGLGNTGLGRYTMSLVGELVKIDRENEYYLLLREKAYSDIIDQPHPTSPLLKGRSTHSLVKRGLGGVLPKNFHPVAAEARHYSVKEQWVLPRVLNQIQPDLVHVPHFNIPIFWRGKLVVTIHDLIKHQSVGPETSTLPMPMYWLKHRVYREVFRRAVRRASAVLVPSEFVRGQLVDTFGIQGNKVEVTYEAPDAVYYKETKKLKNQKTEKQLLKKYGLRQPYLIYVGNAYPHKNLNNLIRAMGKINGITPPDLPFRKGEEYPLFAKEGDRGGSINLQLAIVSARNVFVDRLEQFVKQIDQGDTRRGANLCNQVRFTGFVPDEALRGLYRNSLAFITPSLHEGFGLPGLEAMAAGTLVLSAKASCLPEVYRDHALYFDPHNPQEIAEKILGALKIGKKEREERIKKAREYSRRFSWRKLAEQTLEVYRSVGT